MNNNWTELSENSLPEPYTLVWVERIKGNIYLAARKDMPLSIDQDASRNCWWYGNPSDQALNTDRLCEIKPHHHFSDVTVSRWMPLEIPSKKLTE